MSRSTTALLACAITCGPLLAACATRPADPDVRASTSVARDTIYQVAVRDGFTLPEAVRYDPIQDIFLVANFGEGSASALDNNGFISRLKPNGEITELRFIEGTSAIPLHAPRGMTIVGDTLWVADANAIRAFHRRTGVAMTSVSFVGQDIGFLNDVAPGPDGAIYVTDTGRNCIWRVHRGQVTKALADTALGAPNGITWDAANNRMLVVPYGGAHAIRAWVPGSTTLTDVATSPGARFDGVEVLANGGVLVASQSDSSLHLFTGGTGRAIIRISGPPADIGIDTRHNRVAVPIIRMNRVEIWQLPSR